MVLLEVLLCEFAPGVPRSPPAQIAIPASHLGWPTWSSPVDNFAPLPEVVPKPCAPRSGSSPRIPPNPNDLVTVDVVLSLKVGVGARRR